VLFDFFSLFSVINLTNLGIKRIIKMAKQISAFSQLCQEDQVKAERIKQ
jgi:hypothetical protein